MAEWYSVPFTLYIHGARANPVAEVPGVLFNDHGTKSARTYIGDDITRSMHLCAYESEPDRRSTIPGIQAKLIRISTRAAPIAGRALRSRGGSGKMARDNTNSSTTRRCAPANIVDPADERSVGGGQPLRRGRAAGMRLMCVLHA